MPDTVTVRGADRRYVLSLASTNAMCRLEEATGRDYQTVLRNLASRRPRATYLRAFVWAALVDPAPVTFDDCGQILDDIGGAPVIRAAVARAIRAKGRRRSA